MKWLRRLFCRHEYEISYSALIDGGMRKMCVYKCRKCGKEWCEFV